MIVRRHLDPKVVFRIAWKRMLILLLLSTSVVFFYHYFWLEDLAVDTVPASVLGVALAILIGFRINNAYDRWWEGRRLWGSIVNDSRSIARQALGFFEASTISGISEEEAVFEQKTFIYRQIGFVYALKNHLRKLDPMPELKAFLSVQELKSLEGKQNIPNEILLLHSKQLERLSDGGSINDLRYMQMDARMNELCNSMGGCERIKNTVFPRQYSYYATVFIAVYSYLLPFIFVSKSGWATVPFTLIIGFIFFALDSIARGIENPFENNYNDTPMSALCRTIEINLKQMAGEKDVPQAAQAINGFLY